MCATADLMMIHLQAIIRLPMLKHRCQVTRVTMDSLVVHTPTNIANTADMTLDMLTVHKQAKQR